MTALPRMEPVLAFLILADGPRQTCLGCSALLHKKGMLRIVMETPVNDVFSAIYYAIADDYTMADCRKLIRDRHVGQPWGS